MAKLQQNKSLSRSDAERAIIETGKLLYDKGYIVATDGNLSVRLDDDHILITVSGVCKGRLTKSDLIKCSMEGSSESNKPVSSEFALHLAAYTKRADITSVIHAHPPYTLALNLAGITLNKPVLPEIIMSLGEIPTAPFAPPSSPETAAEIYESIKTHDAVILDRHGIITVGKNIEEAFFKIERVEFASKVIHLAIQSGELRELSEEQLEAVKEAAGRYKSRLVDK